MLQIRSVGTAKGPHMQLTEAIAGTYATPPGGGHPESFYSVLTGEELRVGPGDRHQQIKERFARTLSPMVDLPLEAARVALAAADLEVSEIAFVFGDTTTPIETIPALAALVAGKLGLKIPAYDVTGLTASLPLQLQTLLGWREERRPTNSLLFSSNVITPFCTYGEPAQLAWGLSDEAGAAIVGSGPRMTGGAEVEYARFERTGAAVQLVEGVYSFLSGTITPADAGLDLLQDMMDDLSEQIDELYVISPTSVSAEAVVDIIGAGASAQRWACPDGFSFGASSYKALQGAMSQPGRKVICTLGPDGTVGLIQIHVA